MAADQYLTAEAQRSSADERKALVEQRLDELDRVLLGLLPRGERLAVVANVEARVQALGDGVPVTRESLADVPLSTAIAGSAVTRRRRSRLAFSSGVLGIVVAGCLVCSPVLLVVLSLFGDLLGETFSIVLFGLLTALLTFGAAFAVFCGGVSILRLARRGQTATGTGWAITGLCTGALPLLVGLVGVLCFGAELLPTQNVNVTWNVSTEGSPVTTVGPVACSPPTMMPVPSGYAAGPVAISPDALPPALPAAGPVYEEPAVRPDLKLEAKPAAEPNPDLLPAAPPAVASQKEPAAIELED
jgi:hypothetical protein